MARKSIFCRICEPNCPMIAETAEDGSVAKLMPDRDHPVSQGFACHKGLGYLDVHNDPDRVNEVQRRTNPRAETDGRFETVTWDAAMADIGERLRAIRDAHGPHAIATYLGNPMAFNSMATMAGVALPIKIGTRNAFGSSSQDMTNKAAALNAMYGSGQWTIPDFYATDYLLCFGANPKISHWTLVSLHRPMHVLQDIVGRGGKVVFVNPRKVESVTPATGEVVQIKPDTDVYLLAALIHEIDRLGRFDTEALARHGNRVEELRAFVGKFPAERVAGITGIDAEAIRRMADEFSAAPSASVYMGTGVNQGRQGTLAYWLLNMLSFVTGNLGRAGGNYYGRGPKPVPAAPPVDSTFVDTPLGQVRHIYYQLPGNMMADLIEAEPVRALIVMSGNPLLSVGGEEAMRRALGKLDLLIVIDMFRNATAEMADYILPSADWLEREDVNAMAFGAQPTPYVQLAEKVVEPRGDRRPDWWILGALQRELGLPSLLDGPDGEYATIDAMLGNVGLTREQLAEMPSRTALLPQPDREELFDAFLMNAEKRVDCCPPLFAEALKRCETIFTELEAESQTVLKMISLRTNYMHNSHLANMKTLKGPKHALNPLHIHPDDAASRGLAEGDTARIFNTHGSIATAITLDESLLPGVVAMSHGYGHQRAPGIRRANSMPGVNVNRLLPIGEGSYEPLSNMAHMTGISVEVERVAA